MWWGTKRQGGRALDWEDAQRPGSEPAAPPGAAPSHGAVSRDAARQGPGQDAGQGEGIGQGYGVDPQWYPPRRLRGAASALVPTRDGG